MGFRYDDPLLHIQTLLQWTICPQKVHTHRSKRHTSEWHMFFGKIIFIGLDNGLSPGRRQAFVWTNAGKLLIGPFGNKLQWYYNRNHYISLKMCLKMSSGKYRPFCLGLNTLFKTDLSVVDATAHGDHILGIGIGHWQRLNHRMGEVRLDKFFITS